RPASSSAISPAATPNCRKRSRCLSSRLSKNRDASQFLTSHANLVANWEASNSVIGPAPLRPASSADQVVSRSLPTGVTRPIPVMTTRRMAMLYRTRPGLACPWRATARRLFRMGLDVVRRVLDRLDLLGVLLGDRDLELLLEREHELDDGQRVRLQVVDERRLGSQLLGRYLELVADDFLDLGLDIF